MFQSTKISKIHETADCKAGNRAFLAKRRPNPIFNWSPVDREAYEFSVCTYIGNKNKFNASGFSSAPR